MKVKLNERKVKLVVKQLNEVLDYNKIFGREFNKQIIKELIIQNLTKDGAIELIKELENTPISKWYE